MKPLDRKLSVHFSQFSSIFSIIYSISPDTLILLVTFSNQVSYIPGYLIKITLLQLSNSPVYENPILL